MEKHENDEYVIPSVNAKRNISITRNFSPSTHHTLEEKIYFIEINAFEDSAFVSLNHEEMLELFTAFVAVKDSYKNLKETE